MKRRLTLLSIYLSLIFLVPIFSRAQLPKTQIITPEPEIIKEPGVITGPEEDVTTPIMGTFDLKVKNLPIFTIPEFTLTAVVEKDFVLLLWTEVKDVSGFNVYSKQPDKSYSKVNQIPITPITDCSTIRSLIGSGSPESTVVYNTLGVTPCEIHSVPTSISSSAQAIWCNFRSTLATTYYKIGLVMGTAYLDSSATQGIYYYMVRGIKASAETTLVTDFKVEAGKIVLLPAPTSVAADSADSKVFIHWNSLPDAIGFDIYRSTNSSGPYLKLNSSLITGEFVVNPIKLDTIWTNGSAGKPGFLDESCINNTTYYYKVQAKDLLERLGKYSSVVTATPRDMTPPKVPKDIAVEPLYGSKYGLKIVWPKVTKDENDWIEKVAGYDIFRYPSYELAIQDTTGKLGKKINATLIPQPKDTIIQVIEADEFGQLMIYDRAISPNVEFEELYPSIKPDTTYWYRVQCEDSAIPKPNKSHFSAAVFGSFKDTVPPQSPTNLVTYAAEDSIVLTWMPPTDADLAGFNVFRGICGCESIYVYGKIDPQNGDAEELIESKTRVKSLLPGWEFKRAYCRDYNLNLMANIDSAQANRYVDHSLPAESPLCYRYGVKAYDKNQNFSRMSVPVCDRLSDKTGPPASVIAGLKARDRAILVQWVAPPVQDLHGFVVERSETGFDRWKQMSEPIKFPSVVTCESIPATNIWAANSIFSFVDTTVIPKKTYWYRIIAADKNANFGDTSVPIETYTFDFSVPLRPNDLSVVQPSDQCALVITWKPVYDTKYLGFVVFRSSNMDCCYRQISPIIQGNEFIDDKVTAEKTYWYKVQYFGKDGNRSLASDPKSGMVRP